MSRRTKHLRTAIATMLATGLSHASAGQRLPQIAGIDWPRRPSIDAHDYPQCFATYMGQQGAFARASAARKCRSDLESYNLSDLNGYAADVRDYGKKLLALDRAIRTGRYGADQKIAAQAYVQRELEDFRSRDAAQPGGIANRVYYRLYRQYQHDVAELTRVINHYSHGYTDG